MMRQHLIWHGGTHFGKIHAGAHAPRELKAQVLDSMDIDRDRPPLLRAARRSSTLHAEWAIFLFRSSRRCTEAHRGD